MQPIKKSPHSNQQKAGIILFRTHATGIMIFLFFSLCTYARNPSDSAVYYKLPIKASFGTIAVGYPYQNLFTAFNPTFALGTEFRYNRNITHRLYQTLNLECAFSTELGTKVMVQTDFGYRYTHPIGIFGNVSLGIGILNQFHPRETYQYNPSSGEYDAVRDNGIYGILMGYGLGVGYDFSRKTRCPISLFLQSSFFIQSPYFDLQDFPIMPQSTFQLGISIKIRKNEK